MRVKSNKRTKIIATLLVLIMLISVGYAFLSTQLTINGTATVKNNSWNIYFTNVVPTAGGVTPTTEPTTSGTSTTELTWVVSMDTPGQFYEFTVDAVNGGTIDAMINTATASLMSTLTTDQAKYLDYTVTYSDGAAVEQYDRLAAGTTETLKVRVEFKKDITANDLPATAEQITLNYTSQYVQADSHAKARNVVTNGPIVTGGTVHRWDPVNYDAGTLTTASIDLPEGASFAGSRLASVSLPSGASITGSIDASEATDWVVLDVTDDGDVLIIPTTYDTTELTLSGMDGYNNAIAALDAVASIYLNPAQAKSARSITVEDINKVEDFDTATEGIGENGITYSWTNRYGMNLTTFNIVDHGENNAQLNTYKMTEEYGPYSYSLNESSSYLTGSCWLASRCVGLNSDECSFYVRNLGDGGVSGNYLFCVNDYGYGYDYSYGYAVLPVVTLKSGIHMDWDDTNDVWELNQ